MKNRMQDLDFEQTVAFDSVKDFEFTRKAEISTGGKPGWIRR